MSTFITGPAGSGKTTELLTRAARVNSPLIITPRGFTPADLAITMLPGAQLIDDRRASELFEDAAKGLFELSWVEFLETDLDFEIPGLRAPARFAQAAFRLCCKLREALITPEAFLETALRGATQFYAKPPNFATADLLHYTKDAYRSSLDVDTRELQRQYKHEAYLAKILAKLYRAYLDHPVRAGCLTPRDAIAEAVAEVERDETRATRLRTQHPQAFVDDAHDLTVGELVFLQRIYSESLEGVTLAFDKDSALSTFRGARPDRVNAIPGERVELTQQYRNPYAIDVAARHLLGLNGTTTVSTDPRIALQLFRATTQNAEARYVAEHVASLLAGGADADQIAVLFRSVEAAGLYRDALLGAGVPVEIAGDYDISNDSFALDALAVLWAVYDPFRHDYLLRFLQGRVLGLSDASVQVLCSASSDAQTQLFVESDGESQARSGRWETARDIRLGLNVLRGDRDGDLTQLARERLHWLRAERERWLDALRIQDLPSVMKLIWRTGLARAGAPQSAQARYQRTILEHLIAQAEQFCAKHAAGSLGEFLEQLPPLAPTERGGAVRLLNLDAARGRAFDHIVVPNVRAGAFPRWYVPDSFLYSPSLGMIAKENVGDATSSRTAKFTYYMWRTKARETYNLEERRAFVYALRRAKVSALVTTSGRSTRGVTAPEFFAELQAARLPGVQDFSDRWRSNRVSGS